MDTVGTADRKDPKDFVWWAEDNLSYIICTLLVERSTLCNQFDMTTTAWDRIDKDFRLYLEKAGYSADEFNERSFERADAFNSFNAFKKNQQQQQQPVSTIGVLLLNQRCAVHRERIALAY